MKTLSVMNPWGHFIMYNGKGVENRSWETFYRGRILIHVSKKMIPDYEVVVAGLWHNGLLEGFHLEDMEAVKSECGHIIGSVEIYGCVRNSHSHWAEAGLFHWQLRDPIPFEKPILTKGALGLWEYKGDGV
ncbi:hypothetical protein FACS1894106_2630 [Spirochaetia bacterium]|nr:hypothetical protein FACS1894106_2630 [Spirochaetia bacterium]